MKVCQDCKFSSREGRKKKGINDLGKADNFHLPHIMKVGGSLCSLCTSHPTSPGGSFSP